MALMHTKVQGDASSTTTADSRKRKDEAVPKQYHWLVYRNHMYHLTDLRFLLLCQFSYRESSQEGYLALQEVLCFSNLVARLLSVARLPCDCFAGKIRKRTFRSNVSPLPSLLQPLQAALLIKISLDMSCMYRIPFYHDRDRKPSQISATVLRIPRQRCSLAAAFVLFTVGRVLTYNNGSTRVPPY